MESIPFDDSVNSVYIYQTVCDRLWEHALMPSLHTCHCFLYCSVTSGHSGQDDWLMDLWLGQSQSGAVADGINYLFVII